MTCGADDQDHADNEDQDGADVSETVVPTQSAHFRIGLGKPT